MPVYTYKNKKGVEFDKVMSIAEMEEFEDMNPIFTRVYKQLGISHDGDGIANKIDSDFKHRLKEIKKAYPRSSVNTW